MTPEEKQAILDEEEKRLRVLARAIYTYQGQTPPDDLDTIGWIFLMPVVHNLALEVANKIHSTLFTMRYS